MNSLNVPPITSGLFSQPGLSMHHADSSRAPSLPRSFWITAALCVGLSVAIGIWHFTRPGLAGPPMSFPPLTVDADKIDAAQTERHEQLGDISDDPRYRRFLESVRTSNQMQFEQSDDAALSRQDRRLRAHATDIIPLTEWSNFLGAGTPVFEACREGLQRVMTDVDAGDLASDAALDGNVPDSYETYRKNCGNLYPVLAERRLITDAGSWRSPDAPSLFDLSQRYRWASIIARHHSPWRQFKPYERRIFLRWRIETPGAFSREVRQRSIDIAERYLEDYNAPYARAMLAWEEGNRAAALRHLKKAAQTEPNSDRIARALRWAQASVN